MFHTAFAIGAVITFAFTKVNRKLLYVDSGIDTNREIISVHAVSPSFNKVPEKLIDRIYGVNVTIECNASGVPKPTVEWTRSLLPLPRGRNQQQNGVLNIREVQPQDSGNYTCKASNKVGTIRTTTKLVVGKYCCFILTCFLVCVWFFFVVQKPCLQSKRIRKETFQLEKATKY